MEVSTIPQHHGCRLPQDSRLSHAYLHALIENNPVAVAVLDSSHCFQMCNAAFSRLFQHDASDLETYGIDASLAGLEYLEEAQEATQAVLMGKQVRFRSKRRRRDGLLIDVAIQGIPLLIEERVEGVLGLYQDLTERVKLSDFLEGVATERTTTHCTQREHYGSRSSRSLSQELALLGLSLNRLGELLPEQSKDAENVFGQTQVLAATCADLVREERWDLRDRAVGAFAQSQVGISGKIPRASLRTGGMTSREIQIVRLLVAGLSSKEVAARLDIGTRTVETHRLNVYRKLRLRNIADLVIFAIHNGLLDPERVMNRTRQFDPLNSEGWAVAGLAVL